VRRKFRDEAVAGAVIVGGMVLLVLVLAAVTDRLPWASRENVTVVFEDVRGLKRGDPVFFHGVSCGRVTAVEHKRRNWAEIWPDMAAEPAVRVIVTLSVDPAVAQLLRQNAQVTVEKTITGITAVMMREGSGPPWQPGVALRGSPSAELSSVAEEALTVGRSIEEAAEALKATLNELGGDGRLASLLDEVNSAVKELRAGAKGFRETLARVGPEVEKTTKNLSRTAALITERGEALGKAIDNASAAAENVKDLSHEVLSFLKRNRQRLDDTVRQAAETADNIAGATGEIRRQPWRLLYRPDPEECSTLAVLDAVREFNLAAARLQRAVREAAVLRQGPPEMRTLSEEIMSQVTRALGRYREAEEALWAELTR